MEQKDYKYQKYTLKLPLKLTQKFNTNEETTDTQIPRSFKKILLQWSSVLCFFPFSSFFVVSRFGW